MIVAKARLRDAEHAKRSPNVPAAVDANAETNLLGGGVYDGGRYAPAVGCGEPFPAALYQNACPKPRCWIRILPALPEEIGMGNAPCAPRRGRNQVDALWTESTMEYTLRCSKPTEATLNVLRTDMGRYFAAPDKPFRR